MARDMMEYFGLLSLVALYLVLCWLVSLAAEKRGRPAYNFAVLSFFLTPLAGYLILLAVASDSRSEDIRTGRLVRCEACGEWIQPQAAKCRFCGEPLAPASVPPERPVAPERTRAATPPARVASPEPVEPRTPPMVPPAPRAVPRAPAEAFRPVPPPTPPPRSEPAAPVPVEPASNRAPAPPVVAPPVEAPKPASEPPSAPVSSPPVPVRGEAPAEPAAPARSELALRIEGMRHAPAEQHPNGFYDKVLESLHHTDDDVREEAVRYLARHCRQQSDAQHLLEMVRSDSSAEVRRAAAECLGGVFRATRNRPVNETLAEVARDPEEQAEVRATAYAAIKRINGY